MLLNAYMGAKGLPNSAKEKASAFLNQLNLKKPPVV